MAILTESGISLAMGHTLLFAFGVSIHTTCTESSVKPRDSNYDAGTGIVSIGVILEYQSSIQTIGLSIFWTSRIAFDEREYL